MCVFYTEGEEREGKPALGEEGFLFFFPRCSVLVLVLLLSSFVALSFWSGLACVNVGIKTVVASKFFTPFIASSFAPALAPAPAGAHQQVERVSLITESQDEASIGGRGPAHRLWTCVTPATHARASQCRAKMG